MEFSDLAMMMQDTHFSDLKKMQHKYTKEKVQVLIEALKAMSYVSLPLKDFSGTPLVYLPAKIQHPPEPQKLLLKEASTLKTLNTTALTEEIQSTLSIENIASSKEDIQSILEGNAPASKEEKTILGLKKGFSFIMNLEHKITEKNLHQLYMIAIHPNLAEENKLPEHGYYRNDDVHVVGKKVYHKGLPAEKLPLYMGDFIDFINRKDGLPELSKAAIIHFYFNYLHPYFDGNGRTSRLLHQWYLIQQGYASALFYPLSKHILKERQQYYKAFLAVEENYKISHVIDVTPFIHFMDEQVYGKIKSSFGPSKSFSLFQEALKEGRITEKENQLWHFVLFHYGNREFSTKQLEKAFSHAAYATIRSFVLKFQSLGLLSAQKYGNRVKYRLSS